MKTEKNKASFALRLQDEGNDDLLPRKSYGVLSDRRALRLPD